jgi:hypothetical protein
MNYSRNLRMESKQRIGFGIWSRKLSQSISNAEGSRGVLPVELLSGDETPTIKENIAAKKQVRLYHVKF